MSTMTHAEPRQDGATGSAHRTSLRDGILAAAPLAVAFAGFGVTFGSLARAAGIGPLAAIVMSATAFAGSAQFAAVSVLGAGGSAMAAMAAAVLLNARYGPIGLSVAPVIGGAWWSRLLLGQLVVDESWAIANQGKGTFDRNRLIGAGLTLYLVWVAATAVGALSGSVLADPKALGLDAAFPAMFLALLWPQAKQRRAATAAAIGAGIALVTLPLLPTGLPIVAAAAACLLGVRR